MTDAGPNVTAERLTSVRDAARRYQRSAADPANSAWVSANAGTGKTYVLVLRVLRLLLSGASADSILCLTFTKAAAAEMSNRLIARLGNWAAMSEEALAAELATIFDRAPTEGECALARCLFAHVLDAPGGLKIMTIHAFCDRVLRRFPLEAGVPPSFTILTNEERRALLKEAADTVLHNAADVPNSAVGKALLSVVSFAEETRFQTLLNAVIARQDALSALIREHSDEDDDPFDGIAPLLRESLGASPDDTPESILGEQAATAPDALLAAAIAMLREGGKSDNKLADDLAKARGKAAEARVEALAGAFLTKEGQSRADRGFITKALREAYAGTAEALCRARDDFAALEIKRRALDCAAATAALLRLADAVIQRYEEAKAQRSAMDFNGLIAKTAGLFQRSDASAWVLYRLDADLRHILVDEAQDTSPEQWALVRALTAEFFSGDGIEERVRTLFAVGDEKQSIYRFQGADPRLFAETGRESSERARAARQPWIDAPLALSFRSTRAVLEAVDMVFTGERAAGLTANEQPVEHFAHRQGEAGLIEIWPVVSPEDRDASPVWEPFAESAGAAPPAKSLAAQIAGQIRHWLDTGERLHALNRPIRPGDILILVRKREPFAAPMIRALKAQGIPVAGADRMRLTEQLAIMDLMALGGALLLPEDDLTLAALLKSPIFDFDDEDLFAIGYGRETSFWSTLSAKAADNTAYSDAHERLLAWRALATHEKPFDFYMTRLEQDGLRGKLLARFGPDAADAIDEFLNLALTYEASETPTLQGFLHWLRVAEPEIKRDMEAERDEVRVMTVHGSKGLEANIVFLADTCSSRSASQGGIVELDQSGNHSRAARLPIWVLPGSRLVPAIRDACEAEQQAESAEYRRLLYVAMTRARDRLYVAGFASKKGRDRDCWYNLICDGLGGWLADATDYAGNPVMRKAFTQEAPVKEAIITTAEMAIAPMPGWRPDDPADMRRPILINPSRLDVAGASAAGAALRPRGEALLRGRLVHALLEKLPLLPDADWEGSGAAFLASEGEGLSPRERDAVLASVLNILSLPDFGDLFGPDSRAEVPLSANLPPIWEGGPPLLISGQIDRLVIREDQILILDFKSGCAIPQTVEATPDAYLAQLSAYRLAIAKVFPGHAVRASLLLTEKPQLMPIPSALLDRGESLLYESVTARHLD